MLLGRWTLDSSPLYVTMDLMSRLLSPYDLNPMGKNPLCAILAEEIDFERLGRAPDGRDMDEYVLPATLRLNELDNPSSD